MRRAARLDVRNTTRTTKSQPFTPLKYQSCICVCTLAHAHETETFFGVTGSQHKSRRLRLARQHRQCLACLACYSRRCFSLSSDHRGGREHAMPCARMLACTHTHARPLYFVCSLLACARARVHGEKPNESDYWCAGVLYAHARLSLFSNYIVCSAWALARTSTNIGLTAAAAVLVRPLR